MDCKNFHFSQHAFQRMFERAFSPDEVREAITTGETIANYPDDKPYPSCLILAYLGSRSIHVVVALDPVTETCHIVTVYQPDPALWNMDFRTRRPQ